MPFWFGRLEPLPFWVGWFSGCGFGSARRGTSDSMPFWFGRMKPLPFWVGRLKRLRFWFRKTWYFRFGAVVVRLMERPRFWFRNT